MIELTFLEELILMKQVHQKNVIFVAIGVFWIKDLDFKGMSATDVIIYYWCLLALMALLF